MISIIFPFAPTFSFGFIRPVTARRHTIPQPLFACTTNLSFFLASPDSKKKDCNRSRGPLKYLYAFSIQHLVILLFLFYFPRFFVRTQHQFSYCCSEKEGVSCAWGVRAALLWSPRSVRMCETTVFGFPMRIFLAHYIGLIETYSFMCQSQVSMTLGIFGMACHSTAKSLLGY